MAENENGSGFSWFVAGLGLGALLGVLYAPKSGRETRDDLAQGVRDGQDYLVTRSAQVKEQAAALAEQGRQRVTEFVDRSKVQVDEFVGLGKDYVELGKQQVGQYVEKGKGLVNEQVEKVSAAVEAGKDAYVNTTTVNHS